MPDEHPVRRGAIVVLDARDELGLDERQEVGHPAARGERRLRLAVRVAVRARRRHVAHPIRVRDRDDDHLRQDERPVDPRAEDLEQAGDGVEVRVAVEQVEHRVALRQIRRVAVRRRRVDQELPVFLERRRPDGISGADRDGSALGLSSQPCQRSREKQEESERNVSHGWGGGRTIRNGEVREPRATTHATALPFSKRGEADESTV